MGLQRRSTLTSCAMLANGTSLPCVITIFSQACVQHIEAHALSTRVLVCPTPSALSPSVVSISLRLDGSIVETEWIFSYKAPPPVYDMEPRTGPVAGGTILTVTGALFSPALPLFCRFGLMHTVAYTVSSNRLACITPSSPFLQNVSFELMNGDVYGVPVHIDSFEYEPEVMLQSLIPARGPHDGGTLTIVRACVSIVLEFGCGDRSKAF